MNTRTDQDLLKDYAENCSEAAFTQLVRRHIDLVHSAAVRMTNDAHSAQDITQTVFLALAQNAAHLQQHPVLSGWLHTTSRNLAAKNIRAAVRRQNNEQEAAAMTNLLSSEPDVSWEEISPHLDAAVGELNESERNIVLLRYFERKTAKEVGELLGISDEAAQKRVSRAVERLREFFAKRGVTIGVSGLVVVISTNAVQSAPIGLALTISAAAIASTAVSTSTAIAATTKTIAMITLQKTIVTAALVIVAGAGIYEAKQAHDARNAVAKLQAEQTPMAMEIARLQEEANKLSDLLASAKDQKQLTQAQFNELLKLRGQMGVIKQAKAEVENDPAFQKAQIWLAKEKKIREQFELHPEQKIPEMQFLKEEDWLDHARHANVDTANGMRIALSNIRATASGIFAQKFQWALQAYMAANQQQLPATPSQLAGYFNPPLQDAEAILSRYVVPAASDSFFAMNPTITDVVFVQDKSTVVDAIDQLVAFGPHTTHFIPPLQPTVMHSVLPPELEPVGKAYSNANGQGFISPIDLRPYATTPEQKAALEELIKSLNPTR